MMKTIERAHTPAKMWEKVKLSKQYSKALEQLDSHLVCFPWRLSGGRPLSRMHHSPSKLADRIYEPSVETSPAADILNVLIC